MVNIDTRPDNTVTFEIIHSVGTTKEHLLGVEPGFPASGELLSPLLIQRIKASLEARQVQKYEDGTYHATINTLGMYDLLASLSVADAVAEDFHRVTDKKVRTLFHLGIRWEVDPKYKKVRIFGPKSQPNNIVLIDLTATEPV